MQFSVLMSAYKNDNADDFRTAVESISKNQTLRPSEIIIVVDGPVPEILKKMINTLEKEIPEIQAYWLDENVGLGRAMEFGMTKCNYDYVARMDADDISAPDRFEKQISFITKHPETSVLGGQISEFIDEPYNIVARREVPLTHEDCIRYLHSRDPFNHVSVMLKKEDVLKAGNYKHWHLNEDSYLWIRMALNGCRFANLPETLVNVRVGADMYGRRGGWKYFLSNKGIQDYKYKHNFISLPRYLMNVSTQLIVQVLMPNKLRGLVFRNILRK